MHYNIKGTGLDISDELRGYVEKKLAHCDKFLEDDPTAHADVELEFAQTRAGEKYRAEFTVSASGALYRAQAWGAGMHAAMDTASAELVKELSRGKKKRAHLMRRGAGRVKDFIRGLRDRF